MNRKQKNNSVVVQDIKRNNVVHINKLINPDNIVRYSHLLRKFKLTNRQIDDLKQKISSFSLTWFWKYKAKNITYPKEICPAYWFHKEMIGNTSYNTPTIPTRKFRFRDKNLKQ